MPEYKHIKGNETYLFRCEAADKIKLLRHLGRMAVNPRLSFTWYDAAVMSQRIKGRP